MLRRIVAVTAVGSLWAVATTNPPIPYGAQEYGPRLGKAYCILFNDMSLVKKGEFGGIRDPLFSAHLKQDSHPVATSQQAVTALRNAARNGGYDVEVGLFTGIKADMRPASFPVPKPNETAAERLRAMKYAFEKGPKSRAIMWMGGRSGLFPNKIPMEMTASPALVEFGNEVFQQAKSEPKFLERKGYAIYAVPIHFEHPECLSCHPGSKLHDVAAVATFAFKKHVAGSDPPPHFMREGSRPLWKPR